MPWRRPSLAGPGAGFTTADPWLPVVADAESLCVESQQQDPGSTLAFVRELTHLRSRELALQSGTQHQVSAASGVFCYERELGRRFLIALNFRSHRVPLALGDHAPALLSLSSPPIPDESMAPSTCRVSCSSPTKA
jgi:alpha-glucosidase